MLATRHLQQSLRESGVSPRRLKSLIEQAIEIEQATRPLITSEEDPEFFEKQLTIVEAQIFCLMLSEV